MEPQAKRRKLHVPGFTDRAEWSNEASPNQQYHRHESSNFEGSGIQNQNGTLDIGRDFHLTVNNPLNPTVVSDARRLLLESLRFEQIDARQLSIKRAHAKTCRWFLGTPLYEQWEAKDPLHNDNKFMWIKGKPGAGKSTLMKFLLGQIQTRIRQKKCNDVLISFFFNARGTQLEKSTVGLYRSLILQLLESRPDLQPILDTFRSGYKWDIESLKSLFEEAVQGIRDAPVICLIDALDECEEVEIRRMVDFLGELVHTGIRLHICFASRHYPHITVETGLSIILEERDEHQNDIATYLSSALRIGHNKAAEQIRYDLQEKASGVFMWVVLVVDILNQEYDKGRKHTFRERLRQLPSDLHELFRNILLRDSNHQDGLLLCIQWVLFAKQPLKPKELYFAILSGLEPTYLADCHSDDISDDDIQKYILDNSKGLAESTKSKVPTIQFIHESVRDFLLKEEGLSKVFPHIGENIYGQSHEALKQCCLTYMSMEGAVGIEGSSREVIITGFPFLTYANQGVLYHADQAEHNGISQQGFLVAFPRSKWVKYHNRLQVHRRRMYSSEVSLLYILAENNMPALIRAHPSRQSCYEVERERYGVPILAAVATASGDAIQTMLELQADRLPLFSFENLCKQLPSPSGISGASGRRFTFNKKKDTMLQLVEHGNEMVPLFFIATEKCDINIKDRQGKTALMYAVDNGFNILVKKLLEKGANTSVRSKSGRTALHQASDRENEKVAQLLIEHGADVSAVDKDGQTPLHRASFRDNEKVAQLLIEHGADVSAVDKDGQTPLHRASFRENEKVAQLLIKHGADVSAVDKDGQTPLHRASDRDNEKVAQLLIKHGADVSAVDKDGQTPLHRASDRENEKVAQLLIEHGADVSAVDKDGQTPLHRASNGNNEKVIQLLIEHGADVLAVDKDGQTPLHRAFDGNNEKVIQLLIKHGADVSAVYKDG